MPWLNDLFEWFFGIRSDETPYLMRSRWDDAEPHAPTFRKMRGDEVMGLPVARFVGAQMGRNSPTDLCCKAEEHSTYGAMWARPESTWDA